VIVGFAVFSLSANAGVRVFQLNGVTIGIDDQGGGLAFLSTQSLGTIIEAPGDEPAMVDVAYPVSGYLPMRLSSRGAKATIKDDGNAIIITWKSLHASRALPALAGSVGAEVRIGRAPDGKSLVFSCRISNGSTLPVPQVLFPDFERMEPLHGLETELRFAGGVVRPLAKPLRSYTDSLASAEESDASLLDSPNAPFYAFDATWKSYPPANFYGGINYLRWLDYGGHEGGISVFQRKWGTNDAPTVRTARREDDVFALRLVWDNKAEIAPNTTWDSGEFWVTPHEGGWAKGIEPFRAYVHEVGPRRALPRHIAEGIGFHTVFLAEPLDHDPARAFFHLKDLPGIAEEDRAYGLTEVVPWFWADSFTIPMGIRKEMGTDKDFLSELQKARQSGNNIAPFISIHVIANSLLPKYGVKPGTEDWTYDQSFVPRFNPGYVVTPYVGKTVEPDNTAWQHDVAADLHRWIGAGMYSMVWDVFSNRTKDGKNAGFIPLIKNLRQLARQRDPESTFSGEIVDTMGLEEDGEVLDYTWDWIEGIDVDPVQSVLKVPRINWNIQDSPLLVKEAFSDGRFINAMPRKKSDLPNGTARISDFPALASALKEAANLHARFLPFFSQGNLLGDSFLSQTPGAFVRGWQLGDKLLVLVVNDKAQRYAVFLKSNLSLWLPPASTYSISQYDSAGKPVSHGTVDGTRWIGTTRPLNPSQMALFEIQANP